MQDKTNIKTGTQAEEAVAKYISKKGFWVGDFNKGSSGSQPFDQIALTHNVTLAYDVKHCAENRFDFTRVEENQRLSLGFITNEIYNDKIKTGFVLVYQNEFRFLSYFRFKTLENLDKKSVRITDLPLLREFLWDT